jgi:short-subunit dehydrogenase
MSKTSLMGFMDALRIESALLKSSVTIQFIVLGQSSTEQLESKKSDKISFDLLDYFTVTPQVAAEGIMCVVEKRLTHVAVPWFSYFTWWLADFRVLHPLFNEAWLMSKPDMKKELTREKFSKT